MPASPMKTKRFSEDYQESNGCIALPSMPGLGLISRIYRGAVVTGKRKIHKRIADAGDRALRRVP